VRLAPAIALSAALAIAPEAALAQVSTRAPARAPARARAASARDAAATHAYIVADHALAQALVGRIGRAQAKVERLDRTLASECPDVGAGAPQTEAAQPMSYEVAVALWSTSYGLSAGPIGTFRAKIARLRWSDGAITRAARAFASALYELASLPLPDLCAQVGEWKRSGFQTIPPGVVSLTARVEAIEPTAVPRGLLARYESASDAVLLRRTLRLEGKIEESEFTLGQRDWFQTLATLGLNE
jgi:hypothetical protein